MPKTTEDALPTTGPDAEGAERAAREPLSPPQKMAVARAARAFASWGEARKSMAKIAKAIVNLRLTFEKEGRADYRGETPQYRGAIASLYEAAIHDASERESFKVAIRYWVAKEFAARVEAGDLIREELVAAGVMRASSNKPTMPPAPPRAAGEEMLTTGIYSNEEELTPTAVLVAAEEVAAEHVSHPSLGPVLVLQSIGRELGPVVAALRDDAIRDKQPGRALKASVETMLGLAIDAAVLVGIDVEDFAVSWFAQHSLSASNGAESSEVDMSKVVAAVKQ